MCEVVITNVLLIEYLTNASGVHESLEKSPQNQRCCNSVPRRRDIKLKNSNSALFARDTKL